MKLYRFKFSMFCSCLY